MKQNRIFIQAARQISIQQPLSEQWMDAPEQYDSLFVKAINPTFRDYLAPNDVRRMGNLMKRALVTALEVMKTTATDHPDAIITGTSIGSLDYTERFLSAMVENGEETLSPTYFMQSTHNTVGSTLSIYTKNHGYNSTYSHGAISFDLALLDACMQMKLGKISTALVGGHEEMIESYFHLLQKTGFVGQTGMVPCGEMALSMMLNTNPEADHLCELVGIHISQTPTMDQLQGTLDRLLQQGDLSRDDVSAVMTGVNGNPENDRHYDAFAGQLLPGVPRLHYKHLFGENFTASALGLYAAAHCLKHGVVPSHVYETATPSRCNALRNILFVNIMEGKAYSIILMKQI